MLPRKATSAVNVRVWLSNATANPRQQNATTPTTVPRTKSNFHLDILFLRIPVFYQVCSTYSPSHHRILRSRDRVADRPRLEMVKPIFCPLPNPGDVDQEVGVGRHLLQPRQVVDEYFLVHLSLQCQL